MKKGDLVRPKVRDEWTRGVVQRHGYLYVVVKWDIPSPFYAHCASLATGAWVLFHKTELEKANEEG